MGRTRQPTRNPIPPARVLRDYEESIIALPFVIDLLKKAGVQIYEPSVPSFVFECMKDLIGILFLVFKT